MRRQLALYVPKDVLEPGSLPDRVKVGVPIQVFRGESPRDHGQVRKQGFGLPLLACQDQSACEVVPRFESLLQPPQLSRVS